LAGGQERSHNPPTVSGQWIAVAAADFFDDAMRPQPCQRSAHARALATVCSFVGIFRGPAFAKGVSTFPPVLLPFDSWN